MRKIIFLMISIFILSACSYNNTKPVFSPTATTGEMTYVPEPKYNSYELKKSILKVTEKSNAEWSIYIEGLNDYLIVEINNKPVIAASVIKLFNMAALYNEVYTNNLVLTASDEAKLKSMITVSSNTASNDIVELIGNGDFNEGSKKVTEFAKAIGCIDTYEEHKLYDTAASVTGRNRISPKDCALILKKIYNKELVSPEYDEKMLELLKMQTRTNKIPSGVPGEILVANKTGENSRVQHDVGIVFSPAGDYIICVCASYYGSENVIKKIVEISEITYNFFNSSSGMSEI